MKELGKRVILAGTFLGLFLLPGLLHAADGWEANITVGAATAENKLSFGQKTDATDGPDGAYDVPAMLNGDIKASFKTSDGKPYWRDIKASDGGVKIWKLTLESGLDRERVTLKWKPTAMNALKAVLLDDRGGFLADMKIDNAYSYINDGQRSFIIEITQQ